jgi:hypothetical protein
MQKIGHIPDSYANPQGEFEEANVDQGIIGTVLKAAWLNTMQRELVSIVETFSNTLDPQNDHQLFEMIDAITPIRFPKTLEGVEPVCAMPFYPEILTPSNTLAMDISDNQIQIREGQSFVWRGVWKICTEDYSQNLRTFQLEPQKSYHIRWQPQNGFCLKDLADKNYNPAQYSDAHPAFDSQFDDLFIARILMNNATPAITLLKNMHILQTTWSTSPLSWVVGVQNNQSFDKYSAQGALMLNWGRTPMTHFWGISGFNLGYDYHTVSNSNLHAFGCQADRYEARVYSALQTPKSIDKTSWHIGIIA